MYTLFVLIYDLLNISLKSLTLLTATFFEWNIKEDFPGYTLPPLMYMNTSRYFFSDPSKFEFIHILNTKVSVYRGFCPNIYHVPVFVNP